jgi:hypothetical protein
MARKREKRGAGDSIVGSLSPFERFRSDALARRFWHPEATYQDEYERPLKPYSVT